MVFEVIEHVIGQLVFPTGSQGSGEYLFIAVMMHCPDREKAGKQFTCEHGQYVIFQKRDVPIEDGRGKDQDGGQFDQGSYTGLTIVGPEGGAVLPDDKGGAAED